MQVEHNNKFNLIIVETQLILSKYNYCFFINNRIIVIFIKKPYYLCRRHGSKHNLWNIE